MMNKAKGARRAKAWQSMLKGINWLDALYLLSAGVAVAVAYHLGYGDTAAGNAQSVGP